MIFWNEQAVLERIAIERIAIGLSGPPMRMNCLVGAIFIRARLGGHIVYIKPSLKNKSVWGHFYVKMKDGSKVSFSAFDKDLCWWKQIWFQGRFKRVPAQDV